MATTKKRKAPAKRKASTSKRKPAAKRAAPRKKPQPKTRNEKFREQVEAEIIVENLPAPTYIFGRPTAYHPSYCAEVVRLGMEGKSFTQIARSLGFTKNTLTNWSKQHPDFLNALTCAREASQAWWEDRAQMGLITPRSHSFSDRLWQFMMKNQFREDYSDTIKQESTGPSARTGGVSKDDDDARDLIGAVAAELDSRIDQLLAKADEAVRVAEAETGTITVNAD